MADQDINRELRAIAWVVANALRRDGTEVRDEMADELLNIAARACNLLEAVRRDEATQELVALVQEAPHYFHPGCDFDGEKYAWLDRANTLRARGVMPPDTPHFE